MVPHTGETLSPEFVQAFYGDSAKLAKLIKAQHRDIQKQGIEAALKKGYTSQFTDLFRPKSGASREVKNYAIAIINAQIESLRAEHQQLLSKEERTQRAHYVNERLQDLQNVKEQHTTMVDRAKAFWANLTGKSAQTPEVNIERALEQERSIAGHLQAAAHSLTVGRAKRRSAKANSALAASREKHVLTWKKNKDFLLKQADHRIDFAVDHFPYSVDTCKQAKAKTIESFSEPERQKFHRQVAPQEHQSAENAEEAHKAAQALADKAAAQRRAQRLATALTRSPQIASGEGKTLSAAVNYMATDPVKDGRGL